LKIVVALFIFYLGLIHHTFAQNLVPNPSFEEIDSIPCKWAARGEFNVFFKDWFQPTRGTTDVYSTFVDSSCFAHCYSTHEGALGHQAPKSGNVYSAVVTSGFGCSGWGYREYVSVKLKQQLNPNLTYYGEMYISHADYANRATNNIGMFFTKDSIAMHDIWDCGNIEGIPQINEDNIIYDNDNWVKVSGYFNIDQPVQYLVIGNLYEEDETIIEDVGFFKDTYGHWAGRYFLDDILVRPVLVVTPDTLVCQGNSVELKASGSPIYGWVNKKYPADILETDSTFLVTPVVTTEYIVYGYRDTVSVTVTVPEQLNDTSICDGDSIKIPLVFERKDDKYKGDSILTISQSGVYEINRRYPGCILSDVISIKIKPNPILDLGSDSLICKVDTVLLDVSEPNATFIWDDSTTNPLRIVTEPGNYYVEGWLDGCYNKKAINITLEKCDTELIMPNVFTPNDDKINDSFTPISIIGMAKTSFLIFNRYGKILFKTQSLDISWDGTYNRKMVPSGVYYWQIDALDRNGNQNRQKGTISLIK
jgi:gliding motility-associated-like protein